MPPLERSVSNCGNNVGGIKSWVPGNSYGAPSCGSEPKIDPPAIKAASAELAMVYCNIAVDPDKAPK